MSFTLHQESDCDIVCSLSYNEAYILSLLEKSNYVLVSNFFRTRCGNISDQQDNIFRKFLARYYNTWAIELVNLCIVEKYKYLKTKKTLDDLSIKNFKPDVFNKTKDDSFIDYKLYKKNCKFVDKSNHHCCSEPSYTIRF